MDKNQLCAHMARHFSGSRLRMTRNEAREFLNELQRICQTQLLDVGYFNVPGIAKLVVKTRGPRRGRNPLTGGKLALPAKQVVRMRLGKKLRDAVERPL